MFPEGLSHKFTIAVVMLALVAGFAVMRLLWQLSGAMVRRLRRKASERPPSPKRSATAAREDDPAPASDTPQTAGFGRRRAIGASPEAAPAPDFTHPVLGEMSSAEILSAIAEAGLPPPPPEGPIPEGIDAARRHPIVFRILRPQGPGEDGLSFYGGLPIGPADFQWPRRHGSEGVPLTFMMQWDCAQLAAQDTTGLLPSDGVLYCFIDLEWGKGDREARMEAFLHHPGPTEGWAEIPLPADAPPIFGDLGPQSAAGCTDKVDDALDHVPRVMPRFPFEPVAFTYPDPANDDAEAGERLFWSEDDVADALAAIARQGREGEPIGELAGPRGTMERPFPAFPHDFGALRIIAAKLIKDVTFSRHERAPSALPELSEEDREALVETCLGEAKELYRLGCQRPMGTPLDQMIADDVWQWLERRKPFIRYGFEDLAVDAADLSLGVGSRALGQVPDALIEQAMRRHTLAHEYLAHEYFVPAKHGDRQEYERLKAAGEIPLTRKVHAPTPAHMFGPPSYVQGYVEELVDDHVLLLELPSHGAPGLAIGEGVLQYMIRPDDLGARRFDRVESVISGY